MTEVNELKSSAECVFGHESFKLALLSKLQTELIWWKIELNETEDILITIADHKSLRSSYNNLGVILWLLVPEVAFKPEEVKLVITNESGTGQVEYIFKPGKE